MNISHLSCFGNSTALIAEQGTNQTQYLEPDYFLPSSDSESYYRKKYSGKFNNSTILCIKVKYLFKREKISRVISILLVSLSFLATTLEVKAQPNTESSTLGQSTIVPNQSFVLGNSSVGPRINEPTPPKMPQSLLTPPPAPPIPPVLPAMSDLVSDASSGAKTENRSAFLESIRNFGKEALRKVKEELNPKVAPNDSGDLMSELYNTLERRRSGISGEKKDAKSKKVVKQAKLTTLTLSKT